MKKQKTRNYKQNSFRGIHENVARFLPYKQNVRDDVQALQLKEI
jgi:hypothetical protein